FGNYAAALTDITAATSAGPFLSAPATVANLSVGVFNTYSTNSGDATNGVYDATDRQRFSHNANASDAQCQTGTAICQLPGGDTTKRDDRFLRKVRAVSPQALNRYNFDVFW